MTPSNLAQLFPFALCFPLIWLGIAYARAAYYFPKARMANLLLVIMVVFACFFIYAWYTDSASISLFPLPYLFLLPAFISQLIRNAPFRELLHQKIILFQPLRPATDTARPSFLLSAEPARRREPLTRLATFWLLILVLSFSGVLFVGGMLLVPCASLDVALKISGCRGSIRLADNSYGSVSLSLAPNSRHIAVVIDSFTLLLADGKTKEMRPPLQLDAAITGYTWSGDSTTIAVSSRDGIISLFSVPDGTLLRQIAYGEHTHLGMVFLADSPLLVTFGDETLLQVWDTTTGLLSATLPYEHVWSALSSPDGAWLGVTSADGIVLYNTTTWEAQPDRLPGERLGVWSADGQQLMTYAGETVYQNRRIATGGWQSSSYDDWPAKSPFHGIFSADGRPLIVRDYYSYALQGDYILVKDLARDEALFERKSPRLHIKGEAISSDGRMLAILYTRQWREIWLDFWDVRLE